MIHACPSLRSSNLSSAGQWTYYFIISKMFELADSVFLAVLQKEINFLHWSVPMMVMASRSR